MATGGIFTVIVLVITLFFLVTELFHWLWNITMPQVFNLKEITFWQAFRLLVIAGILFGAAHFNVGR